MITEKELESADYHTRLDNDTKRRYVALSKSKKEMIADWLEDNMHNLDFPIQEKDMALKCLRSGLYNRLGRGVIRLCIQQCPDMYKAMKDPLHYR